MWSRSPVSAGAMKSARQRFGRSSPLAVCCRSIGNTMPLSSTMSSPSAFAGQKPYTPRACSSSAVLDLVQQLDRVVEELPRRRAVLRVVEDLRVPPLQLPRGEEERPVDEVAELGDRRFDDPGAGERRRGHVLGTPLDRGPMLDRLAVGEQRRLLAFGVLDPQRLLQLAVLHVELGLALRVEQRRHDADHAGGVDHVDGLTRVLRGDPHGGVLTRGGRAADQQRADPCRDAPSRSRRSPSRRATA